MNYLIQHELKMDVKFEIKQEAHLFNKEQPTKEELVILDTKEENVDMEEIYIKQELVEDSTYPDYQQPFEFVRCLVPAEEEYDSNGINYIECTCENSTVTSNPCSCLQNQDLLIPKKDTKKHLCEICNKIFARITHFKQHMKIHEGIKDFECNICEKKFKHNSTLNQHMKFHSGFKGFECAICSKKFTQKIGLQFHIKLHEGIKDYECTVCSKRFARKGGLQRHEKVHESVKNYECTICSQTFPQKSILNIHIKTHECKYIDCTICNKRFSRRGSLKVHMKTHEYLLMSKENKNL